MHVKLSRWRDALKSNSSECEISLAIVGNSQYALEYLYIYFVFFNLLIKCSGSGDGHMMREV